MPHHSGHGLQEFAGTEKRPKLEVILTDVPLARGIGEFQQGIGTTGDGGFFQHLWLMGEQKAGEEQPGEAGGPTERGLRIHGAQTGRSHADRRRRFFNVRAAKSHPLRQLRMESSAIAAPGGLRVIYRAGAFEASASTPEPLTIW